MKFSSVLLVVGVMISTSCCIHASKSRIIPGGSINPKSIKSIIKYSNQHYTATLQNGDSIDADKDFQKNRKCILSKHVKGGIEMMNLHPSVFELLKQEYESNNSIKKTDLYTPVPSKANSLSIVKGALINRGDIKKVTKYSNESYSAQLIDEGTVNAYTAADITVCFYSSLHDRNKLPVTLSPLTLSVLIEAYNKHNKQNRNTTKQ